MDKESKLGLRYLTFLTDFGRLKSGDGLPDPKSQ